MAWCKICDLLFCGILYLMFLVVALAADPFDMQLGDTNSCQKQCDLIFRNKDVSKEPTVNACYRGCRLFSICHFVDGNVELNATRAECKSACLEAYSKTEEQYGCTAGCRNQLPEAEIRKKKLQTLIPKPQPFSVLDLVSSFCSDIVSSAQSFISSTWTFYLQADDGKVVVFQSQPEVEYTLQDVPPPKIEVTEKTFLHKNIKVQKVHTGQHEKTEKAPAKDSEMKHLLQHLDGQQTEHDFLGCMSKRSGLPRWILAACLFLSIVVMMWLSCASLVTAPDQHVKTQQLSINGDKTYLECMEKSNPYNLQPVIAVTICHSEENEEAGPLPVKVDLDKTVV